MVIMGSSAVARDPRLIDELKSEAAACEVATPAVAVRLREMRDAMQHLHDLGPSSAR